MNKTKRNLIGMAGVFFTVVGVFGSFPMLLSGRYFLGALTILSVLIGIALLAIAFGE